jgi:uncharacterized membrane protein
VDVALKLQLCVPIVDEMFVASVTSVLMIVCLIPIVTGVLVSWINQMQR